VALEKMINLDRLTAQLEIHEGIKLKPYRCTANKLTIGVGRNIEDVGISKEEAMYLLQNDIASVAGQCTRAFDWFLDAPEQVKEAVINLVFNMGLSKFKQFKLTIGHLSRKEYELAGAELLNSNYAVQVGNRAIEIANQIAECQP
jgi:lysozyme